MRVLEIVAVAGGADPSDPMEPDNRVRHIAVGLLISVAVWAFLGTAAAFHSALHASWLLAGGAGLLVAGIVFWLDLLITSAPLKAGTTWHWVRMIAVRGLIWPSQAAMQADTPEGSLS